jgi:transglutaminase-like putative cysteine protease
VTTVRQYSLAGGDLGAWQTLRKMRALVNASLTDPVVVAAAKEAVAACAAGDYECNAFQVGYWLGERFQFVRDPVDVELLHEPRYMLDAITSRGFFQGDCDDAAVLGAALGKAIGLRARLRAIGFDKVGPFSHVIADVRTPRGWVQLDVTRPAQFDRLPVIARRLLMEV